MSPEELSQSAPYSNLYGRELSFDELSEIRTNIVGFFMELMEAEEEINNQENNNLTKGTECSNNTSTLNDSRKK